MEDTISNMHPLNNSRRAVAKCMGCSGGIRYCYDFGQKCTRGYGIVMFHFPRSAKSGVGGYGIVMFQSGRTVGTVMEVR